MNRLLKRALAFLFLLPLAFASPSVSSADSSKPTTAKPLKKPSAGSGALRQTGPRAAQGTVGFFSSPLAAGRAGAATTRGGVPGSCCDTTMTQNVDDTTVNIGGSTMTSYIDAGAITMDSGILRCGRIYDVIE